MEKEFAILEITIMVDGQCLLVGMGLYFEICFKETFLSSGGWPRLGRIEAVALSLKVRLLLGRVLTLRPAYMHVTELSWKRGHSGCRSPPTKATRFLTLAQRLDQNLRPGT